MGKYLDAIKSRGEVIGEAVRLVADNWQNVLTGLGTSRDKTTYGRFVQLTSVQDQELTALYHQNDLARKIVAFKPQEMLRQGFAVNVEGDVEASTAIKLRLRELRATTKLRDAMIWGRLYGGAALLLGLDDGRPADQPLNESTIRTFRFLHVVDRRYLTPATYYADPLRDEFFGEPSTYYVQPVQGTPLLVHRSRLLLFGGAHTSDDEKILQGTWDHSILNPVYQVLRQHEHVWQAAEHLMSDASQAVFRIQGLMSMIAGGMKNELQTRMQLVDMSRSVARAVLLDADGNEDFTRQPSSFTDAQQMLDKFMVRLAAAAEIPVTILYGRSPAGMNATGESDSRHFYDTIKTAQENDLRPELERLVRLVLLSQDGPTAGREPDSWEVQFAPLWQPTPTEQAELALKVAQADALYLDRGVVLPEETALSRFRAEGWSAETQIDSESRERMIALEAQPAAAETDTAGETAGLVTPTDLAGIVKVNEARAAVGLAPWPDPAEGALTVAEFRAKREAVGAAEGAAEAKPELQEPEPKQQALPFAKPAQDEDAPNPESSGAQG